MEKKKSYLSKQVIAAIIIATVVAVALPVYFLLLKPMWEKSNDPGTAGIVYEPLLENEKHSGIDSYYDRGGVIFLLSVENPETQVFDIHASTGDWSFTATANGGFFVKDYESINLSGMIFNICSAMRSPMGVHIAPAREVLLDLRAKKAARISPEELEKIGGINKLTLSADDINHIEIDFSEYGLSDLTACDRYSFDDADGVKHTVYLGDYTVNGNERYARVDDVHAVYKINGRNTELVSAKMIDTIPAVITDVIAGATRDYVPDEFSVFRDGATYVDIQRFDAVDAVAMDRLTTSLMVRPVKNADGETVYNYYDTSNEYMTMLYRYFRSSITGDQVVAVAKSKMIDVGDSQAPAHGDFSAEDFERFHINMEKPYRVLLTVKYTGEAEDESEERPALVNYVIFSEPFTEEGTTWYYAYNTGRAVISRVKQSKIPFLEEDETFFVGGYVSVVSMDSVDTMTIDASALPDFAMVEGAERINESFTLKYALNGKERVKDDKNRMQIEGIVLSDGSFAPDLSDGSSAVENFRVFYNHFGKIKLFTNVDRYLERIDKIDLDKPGLTLSYSIYNRDRSHTMRFYFFDEAGIWALYTVDGEGRYIARVEDLINLVVGLNLVKTGVSVFDVLGDPN